MKRRSFLTGLLATPFIVQAPSLMVLPRRPLLQNSLLLELYDIRTQLGRFGNAVNLSVGGVRPASWRSVEYDAISQYLELEGHQVVTGGPVHSKQRIIYNPITGERYDRS